MIHLTHFLERGRSSSIGGELLHFPPHLVDQDAELAALGNGAMARGPPLESPTACARGTHAQLRLGLAGARGPNRRWEGVFRGQVGLGSNVRRIRGLASASAQVNPRRRNANGLSRRASPFALGVVFWQYTKRRHAEMGAVKWDRRGGCNAEYGERKEEE